MNAPRIIASAALAAALLSPSSLLAQHDAGQVFDEAIKKLQKQQENIQKLKEVVHDAVELGRKEKLRRDEEAKKRYDESEAGKAEEHKRWEQQARDTCKRLQAAGHNAYYSEHEGCIYRNQAPHRF